MPATISAAMTCRLISPARRRAGCQIAVEFRDPDDHRLEIYWGIDQISSDGRVRPASEWRDARGIEEAIADPMRGQDTTLHEPHCWRSEPALG
jgi:hypothetical protein